MNGPALPGGVSLPVLCVGGVAFPWIQGQSVQVDRTANQPIPSLSIMHRDRHLVFKDVVTEQEQSFEVAVRTYEWNADKPSPS